MADRTSAGLFALMFNALASDEPLDRKALAASLYERTGEYDFSPRQMCCDDALIKLALAVHCQHCGIVYADETHERDCPALAPDAASPVKP